MSYNLINNQYRQLSGFSGSRQIQRAVNHNGAMNAPDRFELFTVPEGEKKLNEQIDTRTPNTSIFTFNKEDHTLANMLRARLVNNPKVEFCGYKVPHPLFATVELRIQTDGEKSPKEMLLDACQSLVLTLDSFSAEWTKEYELRKLVGGDGEDK